MASSSGSVITPDGVALLTRQWDCDDPKAVMLIVHGVSEHLGRWEHVADFFVGRGYRVQAYDHRGHGNSSGDRIHVDRFEDYVSDLRLMVDRVRDAELPLVIYGHSMGGLIASAYAESAHPQPDLYVLSAPALAANAPAPLRVVAKLAGRALPFLRMSAPTKGEQLSRNPEVGEAYFADPLVDLKATARFGAELFEAMDRVTANVGNIRTPALVVHGGDDTLVPPSASAPLAAVEVVDRRVFPGLRHEMHNEPEALEVLDFVAGWLDGQID